MLEHAFRGHEMDKTQGYEWFRQIKKAESKFKMTNIHDGHLQDENVT